MMTWHSDRRGSPGSALMAVLWVVALLIALVTTTAMLVMQDVELDSTRRQMFQARLLAETGVSIAMHPGVTPQDPLLHQQVSDFEELHVEITGEDGLLNPNVLLQREDRATLRRLFQYWGIADLQTVDNLINNLIDWVDPDPFERRPGAEERAYGRPGFPFNRPFRSVEEMSLVRGMELVDESFPDWRSWFSVYASGAVDVNEAEPELLAVVTGAELRAAQELRARRLGGDGIPHTDDDVPVPDVATAARLLGISAADPAALGSLLAVSSSTRRIVSRARVGDLVRELGVVARGAPGVAGGGVSAILWLQEK